MKAEELRKDESNMDAANEKFAEAEKTLGDLLEEVGLVRTSLDKDLNS
ncbi:hypothetical protein [Bacillus coahuilensis]|nr:hypothetical protein [Bacillus coahuilensis]